jgi:hypothetical protein
LQSVTGASAGRDGARNVAGSTVRPNLDGPNGMAASVAPAQVLVYCRAAATIATG